MTRPLLALPLAALLIAGCSFGDCSFDSFEVVNGFVQAQGTPEVSDTLTVVFELGEFGTADVWVRLGANTPSASENDRVTVFLDVDYGDFGAERVPAFQAQASGDTLIVPLPRREFAAMQAAATACQAEAGIVQAVCSPPEAFYRLNVTGAQAPAGVRHIRYALRDAYGTVHTVRPSSEPTASGARGSRGARTARG